MLRKDSQDLRQQHLRYGQGGLCDDYRGVGSAEKCVCCFQSQFVRCTLNQSTKICF